MTQESMPDFFTKYYFIQEMTFDNNIWVECNTLFLTLDGAKTEMKILQNEYYSRRYRICCEEMRRTYYYETE